MARYRIGSKYKVKPMVLWKVVYYKEVYDRENREWIMPRTEVVIEARTKVDALERVVKLYRVKPNDVRVTGRKYRK